MFKKMFKKKNKGESNDEEESSNDEEESRNKKKTRKKKETSNVDEETSENLLKRAAQSANKNFISVTKAVREGLTQQSTNTFANMSDAKKATKNFDKNGNVELQTGVFYSYYNAKPKLLFDTNVENYKKFKDAKLYLITGSKLKLDEYGNLIVDKHKMTAKMMIEPSEDVLGFKQGKLYNITMLSGLGDKRNAKPINDKTNPIEIKLDKAILTNDNQDLIQTTHPNIANGSNITTANTQILGQQADSINPVDKKNITVANAQTPEQQAINNTLNTAVETAVEKTNKAFNAQQHAEETIHNKNVEDVENDEDKDPKLLAQAYEEAAQAYDEAVKAYDEAAQAVEAVEAVEAAHKLFVDVLNLTLHLVKELKKVDTDDRADSESKEDSVSVSVDEEFTQKVNEQSNQAVEAFNQAEKAIQAIQALSLSIKTGGSTRKHKKKLRKTKKRGGFGEMKRKQNVTNKRLRKNKRNKSRMTQKR